MSLAQTKFDELRNILSQVSTSKTQLSGHKSNKVQHSSCSMPLKESNEIKLLSSLLYLSLMMHKVEDLKHMLREHNLEVYLEWQTLFDQLHSPAFHHKQNFDNNKRVKMIYKRKQKYKGLYTEVLDRFSNLEKGMEELSTTLSSMHGENSKLREQLISENERHKKELASAHEKHQKCLETIQLQNKDIDCTKLHIAELKRDKESFEEIRIKLQEKIESQEDDNMKIKYEIEALRKGMIESKEKLQIAERELDKCTVEKELVQQQLNSQILVLEEKEKNMVGIDKKIHDTEVVLLDAFRKHTKEVEMKQSEQRNEMNTQYNELQLKLAEKTKEIEITSMKVKTYEDTVSTLEAELESTKNALANALKTIQKEQKSQETIRQALSAKENDILKLEEVKKGLETKLQLLEHSVDESAADRNNSSTISGS
jgi:hypothetical protein